MSTQTQYNPNANFNATLLNAGASKTVYALVTPETESVKKMMIAHPSSEGRWCPNESYFDMFRGAWTGKQDRFHEDFFDEWHRWSQPVVDLDRDNFPFYYPCNGASEPIRHLIYAWAAGCAPAQPIHVFKGEYEGYKAMAEAAHIPCIEHDRNDWQNIRGNMRGKFDDYGLFFISAPSAIDGNVWDDFNAFLDYMPDNSVVVDATYVGAVPESAIRDRFNLNAPSVTSIIFSLSKPFGVYYDRVGGIFMREEDSGLFGNKWFKNLTSLRLGVTLMRQHDVFSFPTKYAEVQREAVAKASNELGFTLVPSDVYILATGDPVTATADAKLVEYVTRAGKLRICVTPEMAEQIGTV